MRENRNKYVRPLTATKKGLTDPRLLVDLWLDQLIEIESEVDVDSFKIIGLYGRLARVPEHLFNGRFEEWWEAADKVEENRISLIERALEELSPSGWLEEAQELADACDDGADASELSEWAESLLTDLDDAELIIWAAERAGVAEERCNQVINELRECFQWLTDNRDRFFAAGVFIQATAQTFLPDLEERDPDLALSTIKYVLLLDALEEAEQILHVPKYD